MFSISVRRSEYDLTFLALPSLGVLIGLGGRQYATYLLLGRRQKGAARWSRSSTRSGRSDHRNLSTSIKKKKKKRKKALKWAMGRFIPPFGTCTHRSGTASGVSSLASSEQTTGVRHVSGSGQCPYYGPVTEVMSSAFADRLVGEGK